jgi:hypothetical protein
MQWKQSRNVHTPHEWYRKTGMFFERAMLIASFFTRCDTLLVNTTRASTPLSFEAMPFTALLKILNSIPDRSASLL